MNQIFAATDAEGFVCGFYSDAVHPPDQIPEGAIHITGEAHMALLNGQCAGKRMKVLADGSPVLMDPPAPTIEFLRARAWEAIKAERDRRKSAGVLVGGAWFHSDVDSRIQWLGVKDTAREMLSAGLSATDVVLVLGQPLQWKTLTGEFVAVTAQLAIDVVEATKQLDARLFAVAEAKRAAMETAADPASIDVLDGWPVMYGE
ncbi:DUF4376 domain-containing protein [Cupriavidus taiwanensis]|uniref:DUF4376 domain-containing protein n=1 Tax=Cupriavidus taiwanensis TaxID=164546 RepID=A0A375J2W8_9BURK|nr:DUF4376 domain-containing protein [Cupriavidus taiwanensis]SPR99545.1 hypothetical protein CBM2634_A90047 [Cupriavidus taiwanensis]